MRDERARERPAVRAQRLQEIRSTSVPQPGHALGDLLGGRGVQLAGEPAVGHEDDTVRAGGGARVVGDHDQRAAARSTVARSSASTSRPALRSSAPVGSSANSELRLADQRARDRHPLLLAAGELRRAVAGAVPEPDARPAPPPPAAREPAAGQPRRQRDVLRRRQRGEQVEGLEDEADPLASQPRQRSSRRAPSSLSPRCTLPEVGRSRPAADCSSVDLPDPEGPMTAVNVPRLEAERHAVERTDRAVAGAEVADQGVELESGHAIQGPSPSPSCRWGAAETCSSGLRHRPPATPRT